MPIFQRWLFVDKADSKGIEGDGREEGRPPVAVITAKMTAFQVQDSLSI